MRTSPTMCWRARRPGRSPIASTGSRRPSRWKIAPRISAPLLLLLWRRCYPDLPLWPKIVVATMWLLAAAGEWWLRPLMAAAREGAEGSAASFAALHGVASVMYFGVVGGGVALLFATSYWLVATAGAVAWQRHFGRGPAEQIYRRLTN